MSEKKCVCGHELESRGYQVLELHGESLLKDYMDVELWVCPWCSRIAFFMREKDRKDRYRAECGGRTDEELSALLESPDAPALLRDAAREVLDSRAEWKAADFSPAFSAAGTTASRAKISRPSSEPAP